MKHMKMTETEKKLIAWMEKHKWLLLYAAATLLSMLARFALRGVISGDMDIFLLPWAQVLKARGGIRALGAQVGNYGVLYQTLIALTTYIPIQHEYAYKMLSIFFDYALSAVCAVTVRDLSGSRLKAFLTYAFLLLLPPVVLNSAAWGQCDSIYVFFCVLCFRLLTRGKYTGAFLSYGMAFAFKLQAIFLAPFLILFYLKEKKFSLLNFLLIPAVMIVSSIGGILAGRSILAPFQVYLEQAGYYPRIFLNYPSFWAQAVTYDVEEVYQVLSWVCIISTLLILLTELILLLRRQGGSAPRSWLFSAFLMSYTCVLFLPAMHERYSYLYIIFGLMLAVLEPQTVFSYAFLILLDLQTYGAYLFDAVHFPPVAETPELFGPLPFNVLSVINTVCFLSYAFFWGKRFVGIASETGLQEKGEISLR